MVTMAMASVVASSGRAWPLSIQRFCKGWNTIDYYLRFDCRALGAPDLEGLGIDFLYVSGAVKMPLDALM